MVTCCVLEAGRKWHQCHAISHVCGLCWWYNYGADVVPPSSALAFVTKCNPSETMVKDCQYWKEIRCNKPNWKGSEQIVDIFGNVWSTHISIRTICDNADTITESTKSGKMFVYQEYHNDIRIKCTKIRDVSLLHICIETCTYCIHSRYRLYRSICSLMVLWYTTKDEGVNPLHPQNTVLNGNFVIDLRDVFQEHKPGVKWDLPVYCIHLDIRWELLLHHHHHHLKYVGRRGVPHNHSQS